MKYKKGTFVVVPNLERLDLLPSTSQALYIWICKYANDDGECFPSRSKLAKHIGCDVRTVDKHINFLIELGFMTKEIRHKKGSKENMSNMYQLQLIRHPSEVSDTTPSEKNDTVTISSINYTNLTNIQQEVVEEQVKEEGVTLPKVRSDGSSTGKTNVDRLLRLYSVLYEKKYQAQYKPNWGRDKKLISGMLADYTELQIALMLCIYFEWAGMSGNDSKESAFCFSAMFSIPLFKSTLNRYEVYARSFMKFKFDDDNDNLINVGNYLSKNV